MPIRKSRRKKPGEQSSKRPYTRKVRGGVDVNRPRPTAIPPKIEKIDESLIGKTLWYFHPADGVSHITVTNLYAAPGRKNIIKWGLYYDFMEENGRVHSKVLWVKDYPLFKSRLYCQRWVKALLEKSVAEMHMDKALGLE